MILNLASGARGPLLIALLIWMGIFAYNAIKVLCFGKKQEPAGSGGQKSAGAPMPSPNDDDDDDDDDDNPLVTKEEFRAAFRDECASEEEFERLWRECCRDTDNDDATADDADEDAAVETPPGGGSPLSGAPAPSALHVREHINAAPEPGTVSSPPPPPTVNFKTPSAASAGSAAIAVGVRLPRLDLPRDAASLRTALVYKEILDRPRAYDI